MKIKSRPRVVILGGGFAGVSCARALSSRSLEVTLVDRNVSFEFLPNIHELISGVKTPESLRLSLPKILRAAGHQFLCADVKAVDTIAKQLELHDGPPLQYDWLVLATGGVDATFGVQGVVEHAYAFKSVAQCTRIGERLAELARRETPAEVVVVGGGLEGVEALGRFFERIAAVPCIRPSSRRSPGCCQRPLRPCHLIWLHCASSNLSASAVVFQCKN